MAIVIGMSVPVSRIFSPEKRAMGAMRPPPVQACPQNCPVERLRFFD